MWTTLSGSLVSVHVCCICWCQWKPGTELDDQQNQKHRQSSWVSWWRVDHLKINWREEILRCSQNSQHISLNTRQNISDNDIKIFTSHLQKLQVLVWRHWEYESISMDCNTSMWTTKWELEFKLSDLSEDIAAKAILNLI